MRRQSLTTRSNSLKQAKAEKNTYDPRSPQNMVTSTLLVLSPNKGVGFLMMIKNHHYDFLHRNWTQNVYSHKAIRIYQFLSSNPNSGLITNHHFSEKRSELHS
ncbi:hypothetical protein EUGRSUZ_F03391 [Eucalyptus grandis]|uniref:Uncharacterized protein n=2 Tax=Eucalyptus grandis TaxID=71139 RepID=A0ACC3KL73_EUCGR|nr:hypothetical protein EUGRSUZ_F03391 [Eucalyptus grandis]